MNNDKSRGDRYRLQLGSRMKQIHVYDPPMCCSTGVCGPNVDPALPVFAGMLQQLKNKGIAVERYNLAQQPIAFVQNPAVKEVLDKEGCERDV